MQNASDRVGAIIERERAKTALQRDENRARHPELAAFVDECRKAFGGVHAVVVDGKRYGRDPLPDRRTGPVPSRPPGLTLAAMAKQCDRILDETFRRRR